MSKASSRTPVPVAPVAKVLLIEDEADLRDVMAFHFTDAGYEVRVSATGAEGLESLREFDPDLVLADYTLPDMTGLSVLEQIRAERPDRPAVLIMSGLADLNTVRIMNEGAEGVLFKPMRVTELIRLASWYLTPRTERWTRKAPSSGREVVMEQPRFAAVMPLARIGRGGLTLPIDGPPIEIGGVVSFRINLAQGEILLVNGVGRCVWRQPTPKGGIYGLEFLTLGESCRSAVCKWIETEKPKAYIPSMTPQDLGQ